MTAIALTIAGSDSGGGAGIQADLKAFSALGVYGASVITAITAQNTRAVTAVQEISTNMIAAQIDAVLSDLSVNAIKIGMLSSPEIISTVANGLKGFDGPVVLDPVMVAKSGDALLKEEAVSALISELLPMATALTPNLPESAKLLGTKEANSSEQMRVQGQALLNLGPEVILMKGGHASGNICSDFLISKDDIVELTAKRVETKNTHGTGCTLSSSIAAGLAKKLPLNAAVREAHTYLQQAILKADDLAIGSGHGPVHHFHKVWAE